MAVERVHPADAYLDSGDIARIGAQRSGFNRLALLAPVADNELELLGRIRQNCHMRHIGHRRFSVWWGFLLIAATWSGSAFLGTEVWGTEVLLKDGRVLRGKLGKVAGLAESPQASQPDGGPLQLIIFLDDDLRRTFFSERLVREIRQEENRQLEEKFAIRQRVLRCGQAIKSVGPALRIQPFDDFGRRIFTMLTAKGPVDVIQGITELTPQWTKVEGISHVWDMRIATSSIPRDTLQRILLKQIKPKEGDDEKKEIENYKKVARFYLQSERYEEARQTLEKLIAAFPDQTDLKKQLAPSLRAIEQLSAQRLLSELKLRRDAGQHRLVADGLKRFPAEGVGGEILQGVREMIQEYDTREARRQNVVKDLKALAARIPDTIARENLKPILDEIAAEIGPNTLDRMAAFLQNADDQADARHGEARAGHQRLAVGGRFGHGQAGHGDFRLQGPPAGARLPQRDDQSRSRSHVRLHQAGVGRRAGDGGRAAGPHEAAGRVRRSPWPTSRVTMRSKRRGWPRGRR